MKTFTTIRTLAIVAIASMLIGCGGNGEAQNRDFFTSGSRDADQRASQRMAKERQLNPQQNKKSGDANAPSDAAGAKAPEKKSLYERLGAESGIYAIVDDWVTRVLADPRVNWERKGVKRGGVMGIGGKKAEWSASGENVEKLKKHLAQFFALATGGPAKYEGRDMTEVHKGMHATNAEFDAAIGDLKVTLDNLKIPNGEQKELLAIVESTRPQVAEQR